jgi:DDE superfamily endonuclease
MQMDIEKETPEVFSTTFKCTKIKILADLGFLEIKKERENSVTPDKKTKLKPLTDLQKAENKKQASKRVMIEHINRDCKIFRICGNKYRGKHKNYETNWQLIDAIVSLKKNQLKTLIML